LVVPENNKKSQIPLLSAEELTASAGGSSTILIDDLYEMDIGKSISSNDFYINTTQQPTMVNYQKVTQMF